MHLSSGGEGTYLAVFSWESMGEKGEKRPLATPRASQQEVVVAVLKSLLPWPWLAVEQTLNGWSLLAGALGLAHT